MSAIVGLLHVVLSKPLSHLIRSDAHYGIFVCIVICRPSEDLGPNAPLFELIYLPLSRLFHNVLKVGARALTAPKRRAEQNPVQGRCN